jgi:hypothetical protein
MIIRMIKGIRQKIGWQGEQLLLSATELRRRRLVRSPGRRYWPRGQAALPLN